MGFQQPIMRVLIKVYGKRFLDGSGQFFLQSIHKLCYPSTSVIVVAIGDEYVVFVTGNKGGHFSKIGN
jgi:hypothetical protein